MASIDESSIQYDSDDGYIITKTLEEIQDRRQVYPDINVIYSILKIRDRIKQTKSEWKGAEISEIRLGKVLHKEFKAV